MKNHRTLNYCGLAASALLLGGASLSQAQIPITNIINTFAVAPGTGNEIGMEWGPGSFTWDSVNGNPAGSAHYTASWNASSDTPLVGFACEVGGNPWWTPNPITFSSYLTLEFDIKWDNTSDITIDQFNKVETWPATLTNNASAGQSVFFSWANGGTALVADGNIDGLEINLCGGPGGQMAPFIINTNIPAAASNGWVHMVIPINQAENQIDGVSGIVFHKWTKDSWTLATPVNASFWIDNVELIGTTAPPPPPKLSMPVKATQGLNVFASTEGNSYYDRQEAELVQNSGLSWVGMATVANPVTYSFTIVGYPNSVNCEAYLFLSPNPAGNDSSPDWNETNCAIFYLQGNATSATANFRYKVNEPGNQIMYSGGAPWTNAPGSWDGVTAGYLESGNLGSVNNNGILGTWTLKFTSDTNVTLIAPNGNSTNLIFPAYNVGYFAEQTSPGFNVYLGMQANNADAMNQAVVYANFAVSNTASSFSENFLTDTFLDTTNIWRSSVSGGPKGVFIVPSGSASWVSWTLPDSGFSLQVAPMLNNPLAWITPTTGPIIPLYGIRSQLLASNEIPAGNMAFFELIKRQATQLQALMPGETNAPNTLTGKVGTPTAFNAYDEVDVTINAVDSTYHIVSATDTLNLTTSDSSAIVNTPNPALVGGTVTVPVYFGSSGSWTVTAADTSNTNVTSSTSSAITIQ